MIMLLTILTALNTIAIIVLAILYFKENYIIVPLTTWNTVAEKYNEVVESEESITELPGGEGFFREYIELDDEEE